jgi:serine/threonine-protein kinase SRPK3
VYCFRAACFIFEALTGDYLFNPKGGENFSRDEDHLALMVELLGKYPPSMTQGGKHAKSLFNRHGDLIHIHKFGMVKSVLTCVFMVGS